MKLHKNQIPKQGHSLLDLKPKLCEEWSAKNQFGPENYRISSNQRVWWTCKLCGYEWLYIIANRSLQNTQCPACRKTKQVVSDTNRLDIVYPDIAKEWDYTKNKDLPDSISFGSNRKRWWKCKFCQNKWLATVASRTICARNCPSCKLSHGELEIKKYLDFQKIKYTQQFKIDECKNIRRLVFDFAVWVPNLKLIEYNGIQHYEAQSYWGGQDKLTRTLKNDHIKLEFCQNNNIELLVIHYKNFENIPEILKTFLISL